MTGDKRQRKLNKNLHPELQSRKETKTSIKDPCANLSAIYFIVKSFYTKFTSIV